MSALEINYDFKYEQNEYGVCILPDAVKEVDGMYVFPDGTYLPAGVYSVGDYDIIYEPQELSDY